MESISFRSNGLFNKHTFQWWTAKNCNRSKAQVNRRGKETLLGGWEQVKVLLRTEIKTFFMFISSSQLWWWVMKAAVNREDCYSSLEGQKWVACLWHIHMLEDLPLSVLPQLSHYHHEKMQAFIQERSLLPASIPTGFNSTADRTSELLRLFHLSIIANKKHGPFGKT